MKYVPNALTIARIVLTPVMLVLLLSDTLFGLIGALSLFVLAAISDYLDGKIARSFKVRSRLGHFLDPVADKVLVLGTFVVLAFLLPHVVPWWAVALIALRDASVTVLRSWAVSRGRTIRTLNVAKAKTVVQIAFLIVVLGVMIGAKMPGSTGAQARLLLEGPILFFAMLVVVGITIATGVVYLLRQSHPPLPG